MSQPNENVVVGFFTRESLEFWFFEYGEGVNVIREKKRPPKGDGSPHHIVELKLLDESLRGTFYPDGMIMKQSFEEL